MDFMDAQAPDAILRVCVDRTGEEGRLSGRVYSRRLTEPVPFTDAGGLLLKLDDVLEQQNFPQAFQRPHTFARRRHSLPVVPPDGEGMAAETVEEARGAAATFLLCITSRRNASWQGWVDWLDGSGTQHEFASALELIRMIESRLPPETPDGV